MPDPRYSPQARAERLIAAARAGFAGVSLLAIYLDHTEPTKYAELAYGCLAGYVLYAVAVLLWILRSEAPLGRLPLVTHVVDLAVFTLFNYFTEAPNSPFFAYFTFSVICGALRWRWRGALWTGLVATVAYVAMGAYNAEVLQDPTFQLNRFIIRGVYLGVIASLMAFVGAFEDRARAEIASLAAWPQPASTGLETLEVTVERLLQAAAEVLRAPRMALLWEETDEPWLNVAVWSKGSGLSLWREAPGTLEPLANGPAADADFLCVDVTAPRPAVLVASGRAVERWTGDPLHPALRQRLNARGVVALRVPGESLTGLLLALDRPDPSSDDLLLGRVVADAVAARMDLHFFSRRLEQAAAAQERVRLARDLHDGILQSLTGVALTVRALDHTLERDPVAARARLAEIGEVLAAEQRELRFFIQELRSAAVPAGGTAPDLLTRLREMAGRIENLWETRVTVEGSGSLAAAEALTPQLYPMVQEALVNAVKHAHARTVTARLAVEDGWLRLLVEDDGHGFPFRGRYDLDELNAQKLGPVTLKGRIGSLDGRLVLESSGEGARLDVRLPLRSTVANVG